MVMQPEKKEFRVLVIEDNAGDFTLVEDFLREQIQDPCIVQAKTFKEASSILSAGTTFDVILLDLTLPDKNGNELIGGILQLSAECPVIILTGFSDMQFSIQSISLGVADYLLKADLNGWLLYKSIIFCIEEKKRLQQIKESEKRYSDLFRLNPQPIWIIDVDTFRFMQVNNAAIQHYGYTADEFLSMTLLDILYKEDVHESLEVLDAYAGKDEVIRWKFRHQKKTGELIDVEACSSFIMMDGKKYRMAIISDVTEKIRVEHQITQAIIKTQEDERNEIGAELHDNVCQILATSHLSLGRLKESLKPSALPLFDLCCEHIDLATREIRQLSHRLAPAFFNDSTLEEAFEMLLHTFNLEDQFKITLYFDKAIEKANIDRYLQLNLFRILQEQLRNILNYSGGTSIEVDVVINKNRLKMRIGDNGVGFDIKSIKGGIGLANMKRRVELFGGRLEVHSSPGNGCEVVIDVPLPIADTPSIKEPLFFNSEDH